MRQWIFEDLRYAARSLRNAPTFTAAVVLTVALGIGANGAIFAIVNAVLLKPLPVAQPQELFFLAHGSGTRPSLSSTYPLFTRYRTLTDVFNGVSAYNVQEFKVSTDAGLVPVAGQFIAANYHQLLGVPFVLGGGFSAESDQPAAGSLVAVISESYWTRVYSRDSNVVGKPLRVQGQTVTIVGVTAAGFHGMRPGTHLEISLPLAMRELVDEGFLERHETWTGLNIVARLRAGISEGNALMRVDGVLQTYISTPEHAWMKRSAATADAFRTARLVPAARGTEGLRIQYDRALRVLLAMVGLVLLVACVNIAHLLLVRWSGRAKEIAIRASLGATRFRLARQFMTESLLLTTAGGIAGLFLAVWGATAIAAMFGGGQFPVLLDIEPDQRLLAFTAGLVCITSVLAGLLPTVRGSSPDIATALKAAVAPHRPSRFGLESTLTIAQIAITVLLVAATASLVRSLHTLKSSDSGFRKNDVLLFYVDAGGRDSDTRARPVLLERLRALPGVTAAAFSTATPLATDEESRPIRIPGPGTEGDGRSVLTNRVSPQYFGVFGIPLLQGRAFTDQDAAAAPRVAIVSETMARLDFAGSDPIGRTMFFAAAPDEPVTIVGVARDVQQQSLRQPPPRLVYVPLAQAEEDPALLTAAIQTVQNARSLEREARAVVAAHDAELLVTYMRTIQEQMALSLIRERVLAWLSIGFGLLALILACVGIYGVMAHMVVRRTREIGIRLALGALPSVVLWRTLSHALVMCGTGLLIGLTAAALLAPALAAFVHGLSPRDPRTLFVTALVLLATTLLAGYGPAHRSATVDPIRALRMD